MKLTECYLYGTKTYFVQTGPFSLCRIEVQQVNGKKHYCWNCYFKNQWSSSHDEWFDALIQSEEISKATDTTTTKTRSKSL